MAHQMIKALTKTEMVIENVIHMIADKPYKPGDKLPPEGYFIEAFGVSRVTVREAFSRLSSMGVVSIRQGDGTFVNAVKPFEIKTALLPLLTLSEKSVDDLYDTRICIEQHIIELVIQNKTGQALAVLRQLVLQMEQDMPAALPEPYSELDRAFHDTLSQFCGNTIIQSIYESLSVLRRQGIRSSNESLRAMQRSQQDHVKMLEAIEKGDVHAARQTMKAHLLYSKERLLLAIRKFG